MRICAGNEYALGLYQRSRPGDSFLPVDTLKAGEAALHITMGPLPARSGGQGDCRSCNALMTGEKLYSERDIILGGDTLQANTNLIDAAAVVELAMGEPGGWVFSPETRFEKGDNTFRYEADMEWKGKRLLTIRDTVRFWVDETIGF